MFEFLIKTIRNLIQLLFVIFKSKKTAEEPKVIEVNQQNTINADDDDDNCLTVVVNQVQTVKIPAKKESEMIKELYEAKDSDDLLEKLIMYESNEEVKKALENLRSIK